MDTKSKLFMGSTMPCPKLIPPQKTLSQRHMHAFTPSYLNGTSLFSLLKHFIHRLTLIYQNYLFISLFFLIFLTQKKKNLPHPNTSMFVYGQEKQDQHNNIGAQEELILVYITTSPLFNGFYFDSLMIFLNHNLTECFDKPSA